MTNKNSEAAVHSNEVIPLGQRLFDNWPLLMILGIVIMLVIYTGWGLYEIVNMPPAELP
jgi:hypothetical protein